MLIKRTNTTNNLRNGLFPVERIKRTFDKIKRTNAILFLVATPISTGTFRNMTNLNCSYVINYITTIKNTINPINNKGKDLKRCNYVCN